MRERHDHQLPRERHGIGRRLHLDVPGAGTPEGERAAGQGFRGPRRVKGRRGVADGEIAIEDPRAPDVRRLLEAHLAFARGQTPPEDAHAMDVDELLDSSVTFFGLREEGTLVAVGALKRLDTEHAEVKSMHTVQAARGRGIGRRMLQHLIAVARAEGYRRVSLETGSMAAFAPARALYARAGFEPCEPFAQYRLSPNSAYMTLRL